MWEDFIWSSSTNLHNPDLRFGKSTEQFNTIPITCKKHKELLLFRTNLIFPSKAYNKSKQNFTQPLSTKRHSQEHWWIFQLIMAK